MDSTVLLVLFGVAFATEVYSSSIGYHAIPHVLHDGHIADTHEVAAAKAEHLAAVSKVATHSGYSHNFEGSNNHGYVQEPHGANGDIRYHGPTAIPHVLNDGHIADTHEVAAAKAQHLAALSKATTHSGYSHNLEEGNNHGHIQESQGAHSYIRYNGPTAIPHVLHDGHIADTHEVAAAKAQHLAALSKATTHSGYSHNLEEGNNHEHVQESHGAHGDIRYHGPTAIPHVLHDGHIADTREVAAAKTQHLAAVSKAATHSGYSHNLEEGNKHGHVQESHGAHGDIRYHGPTAIPHVLNDGHIADTHEVAAAKQAHYAALSNAKAHGATTGSHTGQYGVHSGDSYGHNTHPYHGPLAKPVVLKSGYLADTHEVSAAKEHHLSALHTSGHNYLHQHI